MSIGDSIARHRREKGWTQAELAEAVGISLDYIEDIEQGRKKPSINALAIIAEKLMVGIEELHGEETNN